jgi:hypothetical protein
MILDMAIKVKILFLLLLLLLLASCNPLRKAERRVLASPDASERIFRELEKTRPCANDTSFVTILDTLVTNDTIIDYKRDTINNVITLTEKGKTIYKTKKVVEVKTGYIVDTRRLGILADSVRFYKTSLDIASKTSYEYKKWLILLVLAIIAYFIIKVKF